MAEIKRKWEAFDQASQLKKTRNRDMFKEASSPVTQS